MMRKPPSLLGRFSVGDVSGNGALTTSLRRNSAYKSNLEAADDPHIPEHEMQRKEAACFSACVHEKIYTCPSFLERTEKGLSCYMDGETPKSSFEQP